MDISKNLFTGVGNLSSQFDAKLKGASKEKKVELAKEFEGVFIEKLLDEVSKSMKNSGLGEDSGSGQVQGLFWSFLGKHVSKEGGFGLWKDIYKNFNDIEQAQDGAGNLNREI